MLGSFSFFEDQITGAMGGIMKQANVVQESVSTPLNGIINQVTGGIWKGDGANRFVNEMQTDVVPMLAGLFTINMNFVGSIKHATETMTQAIATATQQANSLMDDFNSIF